MPSALSSPRPAARISRAKSTPPRPMKLLGRHQAVELVHDAVDVLGLDRAEAHQLAGQRLDLARAELGQQDAGLLLRHLREEDGRLAQARELRARGAGTAGRFARSRRSRASCLDAGDAHAALVLRSTSRGASPRPRRARSLTMAEISPRTFCRSAASSSSCRLSTFGCSSRVLRDPEPVELGEHVVAELERLVLLLDLLPAARAQPDERGRRRAMPTAMPPVLIIDHIWALLSAAFAAVQVGRGLLGGRRVERHRGDGDRVAAGGVQPDGVADEVLDLVLVRRCRRWRCP